MNNALMVFAGVVFGYIGASFFESLFHNIICHANPRSREAWRKFSIFGKGFYHSWYSHHVVHHFLTYRKNYTTQFSDEIEEKALKAKLISKGFSRIINESYGVRAGGPREFIRQVSPTIPFFAVICWFGGFWFTIGALPMLFLMPFASQFIHPHLHMSTQRALETAPPILLPLFKTRYFRFIARHHWMHHRYTHCNFNLLPGGDYLLGRHRNPSPADCAEMAALGLSPPTT